MSFKKSFKPLTIFAKIPILYAWLSSELASAPVLAAYNS